MTNKDITYSYCAHIDICELERLGLWSKTKLNLICFYFSGQVLLRLVSLLRKPSDWVGGCEVATSAPMHTTDSHPVMPQHKWACQSHRNVRTGAAEAVLYKSFHLQSQIYLILGDAENFPTEHFDVPLQQLATSRLFVFSLRELSPDAPFLTHLRHFSLHRVRSTQHLAEKVWKSAFIWSCLLITDLLALSL